MPVETPVPDFKSEIVNACSFCQSTRTPDPNNVIVSLVESSSIVAMSQAICETCLRGAVCAASREFRRLSERNKKPPSGPKSKAKKVARK
jgi:hypothetical protein